MRTGHKHSLCLSFICILLLSGCKANIRSASSDQTDTHQATLSDPGTECNDANTSFTNLVSELTACSTDSDCQYVKPDGWTIISRADSVQLVGGCSPDYLILNGSSLTSDKTTALDTLMNQVNTSCQYAHCDSLFYFSSNPAPICNSSGHCDIPSGG